MNIFLAEKEILQLNTKNSPSRGLFLEGEGKLYFCKYAFLRYRYALHFTLLRLVTRSCTLGACTRGGIYACTWCGSTSSRGGSASWWNNCAASAYEALTCGL